MATKTMFLPLTKVTSTAVVYGYFYFSYLSAAIIPEPRKCNDGSVPDGWKCDDGECILKEWICDKYNQCVTDESDEEEGCNLYPDTGCKSWYGDKYVKCPGTERCVKYLNQSQLQLDCKNFNVTNCNVDSQWRCKDGLCIPMDKVCNGKFNCDDGSDETEGCELYGPGCKSWLGQEHVKCLVSESLSLSDTIICTLPEFLPKNNGTVQEVFNSCRNCTMDSGYGWRCDSGFCISADKHRDGIPDCDDGSDEKQSDMRMWKLVICTMVLTGSSIFASFLYRYFIGRKNLCEGCPGCTVERSAKKTAMKAEFYGQAGNLVMDEQRENCEIALMVPDSIDCGGRSTTSEDNSCFMRESQGPQEIDSQSEVLPIELIQLLENPKIWNRKESCNKKKMEHKEEELAHHYYAKVHQVPRLYRNLYYYFTLRCNSPTSLHRYTSKFHQWELEFHNEEPIEALKCWRLHIGSCELLKDVIHSLEPPGTCDVIYARCLPLRNALRNLRFGKKEGQFSQRKKETIADTIYTILKRIWYSVKPFFGASTLYFDVMKDISLAILIYSSLNSMTQGDLFKSDYQFETSLFVALVVAILIVQLSWMSISLFYSSDIFEVCKHWSIFLRSLFKMLSFVFGFFMPAFVLANHIYYNAQKYSLRRDLQTLGKNKPDLVKAMSHVLVSHQSFEDMCDDDNPLPSEDESSNVNRNKYEGTLRENSMKDSTEHQTDEDLDNNEQKHTEENSSIDDMRKDKEKEYEEWLKSEKIRLFREIVKVSFKAKKFRRIYSCYRVVAAVIESYCVITVLVLILLVSGREDRSHNLIDVVTAKLSDFIGLQRTRDAEGGRQTFLETLGLMRDVVFFGSISYSAIMLLTALARYVYQCKSGNLSRIGQVCLGLYFTCHLVTRLTLTIAIYSTAEARTGQPNNPAISKLPASILGSFLFVSHFGIIYWYKNRYIREFRDKTNDVVEKLVHVLANTLVVIPFMTWDVEGPSSIEYQWKYSIQEYLRKQKLRRTGSIDEVKQALSTVKLSNKSANSMLKRTTKGGGHRKTCSASNIVVSKHDGVNSEFLFPDVSAPFIFQVGNVREKIESLWWENPARKLTFSEVKEKIPAKIGVPVKDEVLTKAYEYLVAEGFINKRLYNPRRTKQEYFWLLIIHFLINLVTLCIELANGGLRTVKGVYISWDIRLSSFFMGLIFLGFYYKRYHILKDLTRVDLCGVACKHCQVFCCIKEDKPMQAIPDDEEMQKGLQPPVIEVESRTIQTQTSIIVAPEECLPPPVIEGESRTIESQTSIIAAPEEQSNKDRSRDFKIDRSTQNVAQGEIFILDNSQNQHRNVKERTLAFFKIRKKGQVENTKPNLDKTI